MPQVPRVITIDGQAHTGKSLASAKLAEALGVYLLNTGAMYRTVAYMLTRSGYDVMSLERDRDQVAAEIADYEFTLHGQDVTLNGQPVPRLIFDEPMNAAASAVSQWGEVRRKLQAEQKRIAGLYPHLITEGRDQGTKVFPEAELKFFFTAHYDVQTQRAACKKRELHPDEPIDLAALRLRVEWRDREDKQRPIDPLAKAPDAIEIDTSRADPDEVLARLLQELDAWRSRTT